MQVKCPKCRFRYDATVPAGITEVACVCPRCGTPFTHVIHAEEEEPVSNAQPRDNALQPHPDATSSDAPLAAERAGRSQVPQHQENLAWQRADVRPTGAGTQNHSAAPGTTVPRNAKPRSFFRSGCLIFFVLLLVSVLTIRSCWQASRTEKISGSSLSDASASYRPTDESGTPPESGAVDPFDEIHPGEAPSWIQGTWTFATEYGDIRLTIHGKSITESIDGETASGTFYYENRRLVCDFGDPGNITIYRLDTERQQIDAGNGMLMTKE